MRRLVVASILAFATAACASAVHSGVSAGPTAAGAPGVTVGAGASARAGVDASGSPRTGAKAASGSQPHPTASLMDYKNTMPLRVKINRTCATAGDRIEITADTMGNSLVALSSYYPADNNFPPDIMMYPSDSNPTGHYVWTFVLRPGTPLGPSRVEVLATHNPETAYWRGSFLVATSC